MKSSLCIALAVVLSGVIAQGYADEPASNIAPTKHQMMKDCMAKQKASDGGMPKEEMKKACRDVTNTESENVKTEKKESTDQPAVSPQN